MKSQDRLVRALRDAGMPPQMISDAENAYYDDFRSPLDMPEIQLADDLQHIGTPAAMEVLDRHLAGEFDATAEEGKEWARSPEGQDALRSLLRR